MSMRSTLWEQAQYMLLHVVTQPPCLHATGIHIEVYQMLSADPAELVHSHINVSDIQAGHFCDEAQDAQTGLSGACIWYD